MPHGWRFAARSNASSSSCAKSDSGGGFPAVVSAFADRTPIDWTSLFGRVRDDESRRLLHAVRGLERIRLSHAADAAWAPPHAGTRAVRWLVLLGVFQIVVALVHAAVYPQAVYAAGLLPHLLLSCSFACASLVLAFSARHDPRGVFLLAVFTFSAAAFARALLTGLETSSPALLLRGIFPEAFVPAALWHFAVLFPSVRRFTRFDVAARQAAAVAWMLASVLFLSNVASAYGFGGATLASLGRDDPGNLFWHLFVLISLPAVFSIPIRALRAPREEQARVRRFAAAIAAGSLPFLILGLARMLLPAVDSWLLHADGYGRRAFDGLVVGGLAAMPLLAAAALVTDRPLSAPRVPLVVGRLARPLLFPFVLSRRPGAQRRRLGGALERMRLARGPREIQDLLRRELQVAFDASFVRIVEPKTLPRHSALRAIVAAGSGPVELRRDAEPFVLLPAEDREWVIARDVSLIAALHSQDDSIRSLVVVGFRPGRVLSRVDLWFISMLVTTAAAAWDARIRTTRASAADDAAFECAACGRVRLQPTSCCDAEPVLAALPAVVNAKFAVVRRLGAGGMGVVYLARDLSLGRFVALKTLPSLRPGRIARLRREARTMAALDHPALATIFGVEIWRGTPVLVLEHFPRGTLRDRLAESELPLSELLTLGVRLADALAHMHTRDVLHRDLKPSNIGFTADGVAKVFDLGLSLDVLPCGTPGYLSPETLAGHPPDAAMDLWALATVLRRAGGPRIETIARLQQFFARALAARPEDRFASAVDMRTALEDIRARIPAD